MGIEVGRRHRTNQGWQVLIRRADSKAASA
jgi:hypothetical protein